MRRIAVIAHGDKLQPKVKRALKDALREAGEEVVWLTIDKGRRAKKMARKARKAGAEVVIVAGGDGSVRAAAEGLVHTGTCNGLTFNVMGGAGFDAAMIDAADADKDRLGVVAYVRAGVHAARDRHPFELSVTVDGSPVFTGRATGVLVGNLGTFKGGLEAFPDASPTDGLLDLAVITAAGMRDWASLMIAAARHRQGATPHARLWQGREIGVRLAAEHRFELDGGVRGRAERLDFAVQPRSLTVCAPALEA